MFFKTKFIISRFTVFNKSGGKKKKKNLICLANKDKKTYGNEAIVVNLTNSSFFGLKLVNSIGAGKLFSLQKVSGCIK